MIAFIDTDILLDVALDRTPFAEPAAKVLDALENRNVAGYIAWHSVANFYYLVRPAKGGVETRLLLLDLARFVQIAPTTTESLLYAAQLEMNDFEDAMQVAAATVCKADVIVTRNLRDYAKSPVRVAMPEDAFREMVSVP